MSTTFVMTEARRQANQRNAQHSSGPRTEAGKEKSRLNGLKHGLRAEIPLLPGEDADALERRRDSWAAALSPDDALQQYLVDNAVAASMGIDRCRRREAAALAKRHREAADRWDDDQAAEVLRLAGSLGVDATAAGRLKRLAGGCRWLINRWERLLGQLRDLNAWDFVERNQALAMLGLSHKDLFADRRVDAIVAACFVATCGKTDDLTTYLNAAYDEDRAGRDPMGFEHQVEMMVPGLPELDEAAATLVGLATREIEDLRQGAEALEEDLGRDHEEARADSLLDGGPGGALRLRYMSAHQKVLRDSLRDLSAKKKEAKKAHDEDRGPSAVGWDEEEATAVAEPERAEVEPAPGEPKAVEDPAPNEPKAIAVDAPSGPKAVEVAAPSEPKPEPVLAAPATFPPVLNPFQCPKDGPHSIPVWHIQP